MRWCNCPGWQGKVLPCITGHSCEACGDTVTQEEVDERTQLLAHVREAMSSSTFWDRAMDKLFGKDE